MKDSLDNKGKKVGLFLPNFFDTFCVMLGKSGTWGGFLDNLGLLFEAMDKQAEAEACFAEMKEFRA